MSYKFALKRNNVTHRVDAYTNSSDVATTPKLVYTTPNHTSYYIGLLSDLTDSNASNIRFRNGLNLYALEKTGIVLPIVLTNSNYTMRNIYPSPTYYNMTTVPDELDTSNLTTMNGMFDHCNSLTTVPQMDTSNVTDMGSMFYYCSSLTSIPQLDTSKVTNMTEMFYNCRSLPATFPWTIDCSSISDAYDMWGMFSGSSSVISVNLANVDSSIRSQITSQLLKENNTLTINFV